MMSQLLEVLNLYHRIKKISRPEKACEFPGSTSISRECDLKMFHSRGGRKGDIPIVFGTPIAVGRVGPDGYG